MQISAITICVDYADLLEPSLGRWKAGCDKLSVVTTSRDLATIDLCQDLGVDHLVTDLFYREGATFDKAAALSWAYEQTRGEDWQLFFDADVVPPEDWRRQVDAIHPIVGNLYGCYRVMENGTRIPDRELAGYFQLFHGSDPCAQRKPLFQSWTTAGVYDSEFQSRWAQKRVWIPMELKHQGLPGRNWCGRGNGQAMDELFQERQRRNGHAHERLSDITL